MNLKTRLAVLVGASALAVAPTAALAHGVEYEVERPPKHPGVSASTAEKTKAYGAYCRGFSKARVAGYKGTQYSNCVDAMARAATTKRTARSVCAAFPKTHAKGEPGTPFSRCVVAAAKVKQKT